MPREKRPYLPGAVFHLTARTQNHNPWFAERLRPAILRIIADAVLMSDILLLAYAVMPNHLHLVVMQNIDPLGRTMRRMLRRIALRVHRAHGVVGHVFERRYRSHPCLDPEYVRNAIVYTNLNPVRGDLVEDPCEYPWSSQAAYSRGEVLAPLEHPRQRGDELALPLFAGRADDPPGRMHAAYDRFVAWRRARDLAEAADQSDRSAVALPPPPDTTAGDQYWLNVFRPNARRTTRESPPFAETRLDMRDYAIRVLAQTSSSLDLDRIRSGDRTAAAIRCRHILVERLSAAGHRNVDIARFVGLSPSAIANVLAAWQRRGQFLSMWE